VPSFAQRAGAGPVLGRYDGRTALLIDGVVQSLDPGDGTEDVNGYWPALIPEYRPERTLLLGLGGGTVARLLLRRFGGRLGLFSHLRLSDPPFPAHRNHGEAKLA